MTRPAPDRTHFRHAPWWALAVTIGYLVTLVLNRWWVGDTWPRAAMSAASTIGVVVVIGLFRLIYDRRTRR